MAYTRVNGRSSMTYTEDGPWSRGEDGMKQRLAFVLLRWMDEEELTFTGAVTSLREHPRWPAGVPVPGPSGLQKYGAAKQDLEPIATTIPPGDVFYALCTCLGVRAEWIVTGKGGADVGSTQPTPDFETELANRVLKEMPEEGALSRASKLSGAACFDAAVAAAKREWIELDTRLVHFSNLRAAEQFAYQNHLRQMAECQSDDCRSARKREFEKIRDGLELAAKAFESEAVHMFSPYPLPSDYTELGMLPGLPEHGVREEYGRFAKCPKGFATRMPDGAWSAADPKRNKKEYLQRQQSAQLAGVRSAGTKPKTSKAPPRKRVTR